MSIPVTRQAFQLPVKHSKDDKQKRENLNLILLCIEHGFLYLKLHPDIGKNINIVKY